MSPASAQRPPVDPPREILSRLVAFPTVSSQTNLPLVDWVEDWLAAQGIAATRALDEGGAKAALYAHVGPDAPGGVLLSGHTDVVPVEGQDWTSDPFTLVERDGRLYGRGACDMKGFDALALWALAEAARRPLARPLQIALSFDEEVGCTGAPKMLAHMAAHGFPQAQIAIIGEPTELACVTAHKGGLGVALDLRGHEVHSSMLHKGVNAIMSAAPILTWVNAQNAANAAAPPSPTAALFEPPWTSLHVGMISGGTAHNITAGRCRFSVDFRVVPDESPAAWRARLMEVVETAAAQMQAIAPTAGIAAADWFAAPGLKPEENGPAEALVRSLTGDNGTHVVSYGTEAGQFQEAGYSAVVCGPGHIAQAHQADEYITVAEFEGGRRFMERLLDRLAA